jgi:LmbE family N-acetylglucosaminyl deacetylase
VSWIFLSPHLDDAAFSCGGLIWEMASLGEDVQIWTVCAGDIPTGDLSPFAELLHQRWGSGMEAVARRREEDRRACERLGARRRLFPLPDCIYRRAGDDFWVDPQAGRASGAPPGEHLYATEEAIFGPLHPYESGLVDRLSQELASGLPDRTELIVPLTLGGHVDHRLARAAAETLDRPLWYFADFPYVLETMDQLPGQVGDGWREKQFTITPEGLKAWYEGLLAYESQISTFWSDQPEVKASLERFVQELGGVRLWQPAS